MSRKKVSIIMTVYKESKNELKRSFESILNQTYNNLEVIVVIDNPLEKWREEFIRKYNDKRVKIYVNEQNIGLPLSLNRALKHVTGDYIARMDADDVSIYNRIEKQVEYIEMNNYDLVGSNVQYYFHNVSQKIMKFPQEPKNINILLKYKSALLHPTWLAKTEVFTKINGYRNIFTVEDYDFLLRAALNNFKMSCYPEILYKVSLSENSISRTNSGRQELVAEFLRKKYRKNKIATDEEITDFYYSKKYKRKINKYDFYCKMKDKRARNRNINTFKYFLYTILLVLNLKYSVKEFQKKIIVKYLLWKERKK